MRLAPILLPVIEAGISRSYETWPRTGIGLRKVGQAFSRRREALTAVFQMDGEGFSSLGSTRAWRPESLWIRGEVTGSIVTPRSIRARRLLPHWASGDAPFEHIRFSR